MKKLILSAVLAVVGATAAFAQTDDYKKAEFYVGYSNNQVDTGANSGNDVRSFFNDRRSFNGFEGSAVYNVSRYFGVKGDISGAYRNQNVNSTYTVGNTTGTVRFEADQSLYNFGGGVQVKDNASTARLKPFAHALVGAAHQRIETKGVVCQGIGACPPSFVGKFTETGVAGAVGGGLDVKLSDRFDLRAIQVDYNPARLNDRTQHNFRFGIGLVIK